MIHVKIDIPQNRCALRGLFPQESPWFCSISICNVKSKLKNLREQHGMTQSELGKEVNVSRQAIIAIESNRL